MSPRYAGMARFSFPCKAVLQLLSPLLCSELPWQMDIHKDAWAEWMSMEARHRCAAQVLWLAAVWGACRAAVDGMPPAPRTPVSKLRISGFFLVIFAVAHNNKHLSLPCRPPCPTGARC